MGHEMNAEHEIKLMNFIEKNLGRPFVWGRCDCSTFALEATDAIFDTALVNKIKGKYRTGKGAIKFRRRSWGSFINLLKEAGFVELQRGFEQTGDMLIVEDAEWERVHVYLDNWVCAPFPDDGVQLFPMTVMNGKPYKVWRYVCLP